MPADDPKMESVESSVEDLDEASTQDYQKLDTLAPDLIRPEDSASQCRSEAEALESSSESDADLSTYDDERSSIPATDQDQSRSTTNHYKTRRRSTAASSYRQKRHESSERYNTYNPSAHGHRPYAPPNQCPPPAPPCTIPMYANHYYTTYPTSCYLPPYIINYQTGHFYNQQHPQPVNQPLPQPTNINPPPGQDDTNWNKPQNINTTNDPDTSTKKLTYDILECVKLQLERQGKGLADVQQQVDPGSANVRHLNLPPSD